MQATSTTIDTGSLWRLETAAWYHAIDASTFQSMDQKAAPRHALKPLDHEQDFATLILLSPLRGSKCEIQSRRHVCRTPWTRHFPPAHDCWDAIDAQQHFNDARWTSEPSSCSALTDFASLTAVSKLLQVVGYPARASVGGVQWSQACSISSRFAAGMRCCL